MANSVSFSGATDPNIIESLRERAAHIDSGIAFTWLAENQEENRTITYGELDRRARAIAARLQSFHLEKARVVLLYRSGLDFIAGLFGCFYSGLIAVPAYAPRSKRDSAQLRAILADAGPEMICTTSAALPAVESFLAAASHPRVPCIATDVVEDAGAGDWREQVIGPEDLAYLQYTSGSTARPKGVMVSHANLLANLKYIDQGFAHTPESISLSWLPHFHDMGLVYGILQPVYYNFRSFLLSSAAFVQRPLRWLENISQYGVTHSGGPNFAYDLCVQRIPKDELKNLDLSKWRVAFNGAEPVRSETLNRFTEKFSQCGFDPCAWYPAFGLAEGTLKVTGGEPSTGFVTCTISLAGLADNRVKSADPLHPGTSTHVSCGKASPPYRLRIVSADGQRVCLEDEIGEIWVSGPSIGQGYWNNPEDSKRVFNAYIASTGEGPFLRTGDLGFVINEQLFVTGRLKDCIIIRGENHYPQDIERSVERCHPDLVPGSGVAFSIDITGQERLIVVHEIQRRASGKHEEIFQSIRAAVARNHELQVYTVILLRFGTLPKTTSGKVMRAACRSAYLRGDLPAIATHTFAAEQVSEGRYQLTREELLQKQPSQRQQQLTLYLHDLVAEILAIDKSAIGPGDQLAYLGLDSVMATKLSYDVELSFGSVVPVAALLDHQSIESLAALIAQSLAQAPGGLLSEPGSLRRGTAAFPLSYGQRALWFVEQLMPGGNALNISRSVRISGHLSYVALQRALDQLVERYPILRSRIFEADGELLQKEADEVHVKLFVVDLEDCDAELLYHRIRGESNRPFALGAGPLIRLVLYRHGGEEHTLQFTIHHIISDLWSILILFRDLWALYESGTRTHEKFIENRRATYYEYVLWQRKILAGNDSQYLWDYWAKQLEHDLPPLQLPADRSRIKKLERNGRFHTFVIDREIVQSLKLLSLSGNVTIFTALLCSFQVLLSRYTEKSEFFIGCPTHGRERAGLAAAIGYFVNPLVLRADLSGDPAFKEHLVRQSRAVLDAFSHGLLPMALAVERFFRKRESGSLSPFNVMFVFQKADVEEFDLWSPLAIGLPEIPVEAGGLAMKTLPVAPQMIQYDLTLHAADSARGLMCCFEYDADLFDVDTIVRMGGHLQQLIKSAVADPGQCCSGLNLLSDLERRQLLVDWNDTASPWPANECLHQLVERQARASGQAVAVVHKGERITYADLNARANRLAHYLVKRGAGPERTIAICMERSPDLICSMLAVLKTGAGYLPLDPAYPLQRLEFMLADSRPLLLVCSAGLESTLPSSTAGSLAVDLIGERLLEEPDTNPETGCCPQNLAYVIYTSGSSGSPKGVGIQHCSATALLAWAGSVYSLRELSKVLASTSICFDLSIFEIFLPLCRGGCVVLAQDALELISLDNYREITLINTVPSVMAELIRLRAVPVSVRTVNLAGEALHRNLVDEIYALGHVEQVYNLYGPTEDTTYSTFYRIEKHSSGRPAIGRAISNTQMYLLDGNLQPVPLGVMGEIYLAGAGLARGYLNRADMTAKKFLPNPFSQVEGERMYATGDIGRYLADGKVEYLGRLDQQVKLRGYRIELGEIETTLRGMAGVKDAVVVVREEE
ncbi:MAG TPA: amino acid adenylation domain-containing protein, partial [Candidatus Angelobacter sp.]|nr:amino acid adenylation domain-containing protein [Candidatus Angelobacter sp.]